jgi:hypothetical protein
MVTERQAWLIALWADNAAADLSKALKVAEHTGDTRLIAKVRDVRDRARSLYHDFHKEQ